MSYTLAEVAAKTGKSQVNLRKMIERGQLEAEKAGGRVMVTEEALDRLLGAQILEDAADEVRLGNTHEVGNIFARLPNQIANAILAGIPQSGSNPKKPGDSKAWQKATEGIPRHVYPETDPDDPHMGFEVGHRHRTSPRWTRSSKNTWSLGDASWTWNGFLWEGGGSKVGMTLDQSISPAHPDATMRPLAPSPSVAKK